MKWTKTKKLLAVVLTMAMLLPAGGVLASADVSGLFAARAGSEPADNVVLGKIPSVNDGNSYDVPGHFDLSYLTDGSTDRAWHSSLSAEPATESNPTVLTVDLSVKHTLSSINLYPYTGSVYGTSVMPRDYRIEVLSVDSGEWITVAEDQNVTRTGNDALTYEFDAVDATEVRVVITKDSAYRPSADVSYISVIGELEIMGFMSEEWEIYPTPMSATYGNRIIDLSCVNLHSEVASYADRLEDKGIEISENGVDVRAELRDLTELTYGAEEGYILTVNADGVKIEAETETGLHYGMMSLLQLMNEDAICPFVTVKDAPRNEWRGVIEGFYGEPWTDDYRKDLYAFMGDNKMNAYIYAPKDDPKHRENWSTTYTTAELNRLSALVNAAKENHVKFIYAIAPGLSFNFSTYQYSSQFKKLTAKCQQLYDIGVRDFAILLDDIPESKMNAANHVKLLNQFQKDFVEAKGDVSPLIAVTPEYCEAFLTDGIGDGYTTDFVNAGPDSDIVLMWTGVGVSPFYNDNAALSNINATYGREVLMWWNYPCNDYAANNLFMGASGNLSGDLYESSVGLVANPMNQGYASMVPLFTMSDYLWNSDAYDDEASLAAACKALMPDADLALLDFVNVTSANTVNNLTDSVEVKKLLDAFRRSYSAESREALKAYFESMIENADAISASENQKLAIELGDWLDKYRTYGEMGLAYIAMEEAYAAGQNASVIQGYVDEFDALEQSLADNAAIVSGPVVSTPVAGSGGGDVTGKGVLTPFFEDLDTRIDTLLQSGSGSSEPANVALGQTVTVTGTTYLEVAGQWHPDTLVDGVKASQVANTDNGVFMTPSTNISSSAPVDLTVTLDAIYEISTLKIFRGHGAEATAMPKAYTLDVSEDGNKWETVATVTATQTAGDTVGDRTFDLGQSVAAKYVRIHITQGSGWDLTSMGLGWATVVGELEIYGVPYTGGNDTDEPELFDVALGQTVSATAGLDDGGVTWSPQLLLKGNKDTAGGWLDMSGTISATNAPVITVTLDKLYTIYTIDLYPVCAFNDAYVSVMPQDFTIELSSDGGKTWKTVATESGVISQVVGLEGHVDNGGLPAINDPYSIELAEPTAANMMRMTITKGGTGRSSNTALADPTYGGTYVPYTSIGSIEMMGVEGATTTPDEPVVEIPNVALGQTVTVTGTTYLSVSGQWHPNTLVDGIKASQEVNTDNGVFMTPTTNINASNPVDLIVTLDGLYEISSLAIFRGHGAEATAMPKAYTLDVSEDGVKWDTVATVTLMQTMGDTVGDRTFVLAETVVAKYVRIHITQGSGWDLTSMDLGWATVIGELEVYGVPYDAETEPPEPTNVAEGKAVSVNNDNTFSVPESGWDISYLADGRSDTAWHSSFMGFSGSSVSEPTVITFDLAGTCEVSSINLFPYSGSAYDTSVMPRDYRIEVLSPEHDGWVVVSTATDVEAVGGENLTYDDFDPIKATKVRIVITEDSDTYIGGSANVSVIGEMEVYGVPYTGEVQIAHTAESTYDPATGIRTYGACSVCGKTPDAFATDWSQDVVVKIDESLKMYFYAWVDESVTAPTLKVTRDGREYTVAGTVVRTVGDAVEYEFAFEGVTPEHADTLLSAVLWCDGYKLLTKSCSLQQYVDERKADEDLTAPESDLLGALETYIAALENAQNGANNDVNVENFTNVISTDKRVKNNGNLATFDSATVGFGNDVRIRFTLTLADAVNAADLTFKVKVNDGTETEVSADLIKLSGNKVTVYTDAVAATNFDDVYTVTAYNGETAGASFTYSVKSYVYAFQSATGASEDQVLLVKALYNYGLSAKAYANAQ